MTALAVSPEDLTPLQAFLANASIALPLVTQGEAPVRLTTGAPREMCDGATLKRGGAILCSTALQMAPTLGLSPQDLGKLLNHLEIKVRSCSLGCF